MKLAQFFGKNQLDEMQERTMLTIESRGFWLVWSLLLVVLLGEGLLGFTMREMAGTWAASTLSPPACVPGFGAGTSKLPSAQTWSAVLLLALWLACSSLSKCQPMMRLCLLCWLAPVLRRAPPSCWRWWYSSFAALSTKSAMNSWKTSLTKKKKTTK